MENTVSTGNTLTHNMISRCPITKENNSHGGAIQNGKSVEYVLKLREKYWFPIRATHRRAQLVYNKLVDLHDDKFEPYLPFVKRIEYSNDDFNNPTQYICEEPLDSGLLFLRTTLADYKVLLKCAGSFPGLTPYYNHFFVNEFGKNEFLIVPDRQMESFKIIVESGSENIIVDQHHIPEVIEGDHVIVVGGIFAGVEGIVMKYKHQKRVFVQIPGLGSFGTAYIPKAWLRKIEEA